MGGVTSTGMAWRLWAPGARCRVHAGRTVHAVERDELGQPVPLCRVGVCGWAPAGALQYTRAAVTCRRCLRALRRAGALEPTEAQPMLPFPT